MYRWYEKLISSARKITEVRVLFIALTALFICISGVQRALAGYVYVLNNNPTGNNIYGYSINEGTGALNLLPGFPVATGGNGGSLVASQSEHLTIDKTNNRLYAINDGSDTVSAYSINPVTGALTALPFNPITLPAPMADMRWNTIAVHPSGSPLVISGAQGFTASYNITAATATAAVGSPYMCFSAFSSVFSRDGNYYYAGGEFFNRVTGFSVNTATGVLTTLPGSDFNVGTTFPESYATDTQGRFFTASGDSAHIAVLTSMNGALTPVTGSPFTSTSSSGDVDGVISPNENFYVVANRLSNLISSYRISGTGAATTLTPVTGGPFASGGMLTDALVFNQAGTFLYTANGNSRNITTYSFDPTTGVPANINVQPTDTVGATGKLTGIDYIQSTTSDLSITKTDSPDPVTAGNQITYTVIVTNNGIDNASNISLSDTIPAGTTFAATGASTNWANCSTPAAGPITCTNPSLAAGATLTLTYTVNVSPGAANGSTLMNTASVSSSTPDPVMANNTATASTLVTTSADLSLTKTDSPDPVGVGNNLTYTIQAANAGPSNAAAVLLADALPAGTTFVSLSSPAGWSCTTPAVGTNGTVMCSIASLAAGASQSFTLIVKIDAGITDNTTITNTANISSMTSDPNPGNNSASASTIARTLADLAVTKTDSPDPVIAGNNIAYSINVTNNGPANGVGATLTDTIPANTTFQSITAPAGWICTTPAVNSAGTVSCTNALLTNGTTAGFILVVNVNTGAANGTTITNTALAAISNFDPNPANNAATTTTTVAEYSSPAPTGFPTKSLLVKPAAGNTTAGGGDAISSCVAPVGVTVAGIFLNINQALGAAAVGDTIYVCPKYTGSVVVPYLEQVSLGYTNLSVVGIGDNNGQRPVIAANPSTPTSATTQLGTNYIVQIVATGVNFGNFVVDGAPGGANFANTGIFNGIVVRRSGAFVFNNTIQNIRTADTAANADGQGIAVFGAGSTASPLEAGTPASPVNILNNVVQNYRSNGVSVSGGSSSSYAFVRGNYITGNGASSGTTNQTGVQFQTGANGDIFNNRITKMLDSVAGCAPNAFNLCTAGIRLNATSSTNSNGLKVRFNQISNTQTGIFAQDVQFVSMTSNTISRSIVDGINLRGSVFNLGSNFNTISQNTVLSSRRAGVFIGLVGGDASLGNNLTQNTIEDVFTGVANNTPPGNNAIPLTGAMANTFISVNNYTGSATSGVNDVQNTNPLP